MPVKIPLFCSVLFLSLPQSEGWPHDGRTFSIYLYPLSFWSTLPQRVLSMTWCCLSKPCMVFIACMHLALFLALFLSPRNSLCFVQWKRRWRAKVADRQRKAHRKVASMSLTIHVLKTSEEKYKKRWMRLMTAAGLHRQRLSTLLSTSLTSCSSFVTTDTESLWHTGNAVDDGTVNLIYTHSLSEMTTQESLQGRTDSDKNKQVRQQACKTQMPPYGLTRPDSSLRYRRYINHLLTYLLTQCHRPQFRMKLGGGWEKKYTKYMYS